MVKTIIPFMSKMEIGYCTSSMQRLCCYDSRLGKVNTNARAVFILLIKV